MNGLGFTFWYDYSQLDIDLRPLPVSIDLVSEFAGVGPGGLWEISEDGRNWSFTGAPYVQGAATANMSKAMVPGASLAPGEELSGPNNGDGLVLRGNGELVLFRTQAFDGVQDPLTVVWRSGVAGGPGCRAVLQFDGNLVVYDRNGTAVWTSGTNGAPAARLWIPPWHEDPDGYWRGLSLALDDAVGRRLWVTDGMMAGKSFSWMDILTAPGTAIVASIVTAGLLAPATAGASAGAQIAASQGVVDSIDAAAAAASAGAGAGASAAAAAAGSAMPWLDSIETAGVSEAVTDLTSQGALEAIDAAASAAAGAAPGALGSLGEVLDKLPEAAKVAGAVGTVASAAGAVAGGSAGASAGTTASAARRWETFREWAKRETRGRL